MRGISPPRRGTTEIVIGIAILVAQHLPEDSASSFSPWPCIPRASRVGAAYRRRGSKRLFNSPNSCAFYGTGRRDSSLPARESCLPCFSPPPILPLSLLTPTFRRRPLSTSFYFFSFSLLFERVRKDSKILIIGHNYVLNLRN